MKKNIIRFGIGVIMLPLFLLGQNVEKKAQILTPSQLMDKVFDFWNRLDQPGFAVVVVKEGQVLYQNVFGLACQEHAAPITPNSVFNTATLAQTFVGQAVALLESQGKLSLDDDVRKTIPELPDFGTPVKLRHLLYQSSGIRDWLTVLQLAGRDKEEVTFQTVLKIIQAQKKPIFPPGDRFQLSNSNYDLLAEIIKRLTGKPFSEWAWENIFKPLKMTRTQYRDNYRSIFDDQAFTYNFTREEYLKGIDTLSVTGSHSLFTSIADLGKWLVALETAPAESQAIFAKMFTPGELNNGRKSIYGYGLNIGMYTGRRQVSQTGVWAGSGATLVYLPDQKFGFVVLANWDYTPVAGFGRDVFAIYMPAAAPPPPPAKKASAQPAGKAVKVKPGILDQYAGDYRFASRQLLTIARAGDQLVLAFPGQKYILTPVSESEFLFELGGARLAFAKGPDGKVSQMIWKQAGAEQSARRIVLARPTPEELKEYAGVYANDDVDLRLSIEIKGNALVLKAPGQGDLVLTPDEKDRFTSGWQTAPLIVFQRDGQKRVSGFLIDSDPLRDLIFNKN